MDILVIDSNVYWFPELLFEDEALMQKFLSDILNVDDTQGLVKSENGKKQLVIERPIGCQSLNYVQGEYELDAMLEALEEAGIDKAIMKIPGCQEWMSLEMCRLFNDGMADYQNRSDGRLIALAVVPPYGSRESLDELDRCKNELGMHGIQLSAHYAGKYLDDEMFAALFEKINEYGMTAYVHHTPLPVQYDSLYEFNNLRRTYGRCSDQTIAVSRELFSGMFGKYPNIKLVHSMLGGGFFTYLNMLLPPSSNDTTKRFDTGNGLQREWLSENIFFETSHAQPWGKTMLECAVKILGAEHIVYGSSYPVRKEWLTGGPDFVRALDISDADKELILHKNAERLYHV